MFLLKQSNIFWDDKRMFLIEQSNLFWNGKQWVADWQQAACYGSAATAISVAPNETCLAIALTIEQWEYFSKPVTCRQFERIPFEIAVAGHGDLIPYEVAILSGTIDADPMKPIDSTIVRQRLETALKVWQQTPEGRGFWLKHGNLPCLENLPANLDSELIAYIAEAGIFDFQIRSYRVEQDWNYYSLIDLDD